MNKQDKIKEAQIQLDNREHYRPLSTPMAEDTHCRVQQLINGLYDGNYVDGITKKWLCQTPNPPRIPIFFLHPNKDTQTDSSRKTYYFRVRWAYRKVGKLSAFIDKLLQPTAQKQQSYIKDTTDFINFLEKT